MDLSIHAPHSRSESAAPPGPAGPPPTLPAAGTWVLAGSTPGSQWTEAAQRHIKRYSDTARGAVTHQRRRNRGSATKRGEGNANDRAGGHTGGSKWRLIKSRKDPHLEAVAHASHCLSHVGQHEVAHLGRCHVSLVADAGRVHTRATEGSSSHDSTNIEQGAARMTAGWQPVGLGNVRWLQDHGGYRRTSTASRNARKTTSASSPCALHWIA